MKIFQEKNSSRETRYMRHLVERIFNTKFHSRRKIVVPTQVQYYSEVMYYFIAENGLNMFVFMDMLFGMVVCLFYLLVEKQYIRSYFEFARFAKFVKTKLGKLVLMSHNNYPFVQLHLIKLIFREFRNRNMPNREQAEFLHWMERNYLLLSHNPVFIDYDNLNEIFRVWENYKWKTKYYIKITGEEECSQSNSKSTEI
jgi:hypothetical protein